MSRREDDHFLRCFFAESRLRRREMLAFADPAVPTKTLQNWVDRGLFDAQFALGHAEDLRTQAAEREANEALGRKRL